jgi:hypothetical protein
MRCTVASPSNSIHSFVPAFGWRWWMRTDLRGETLHELLDRLERTLGPAIDDQVYVDEING